MKQIISDFLDKIEKDIQTHIAVSNAKTLFRTVTDDEGKLKIRITLINEDLADFSQTVQIENQLPVVVRYSFHWQDADNNLKYRWDDAPHHPELENFPHHLHTPQGVQPIYNKPTYTDIIAIIEAEIL